MGLLAAKRRGYETTPAVATPNTEEHAVLSFADFHAFMGFVNSECRGIGCGYARRDCRRGAMERWCWAWAEGNPARSDLLLSLYEAMKSRVPSYFRDYSARDERIENEQAFRRLYKQVVDGLNE